MKREILFRGKLSHNNKWLIGNLVFSQEGTPYIIPSRIIEQDGHHLKIFDDNAYWVNNNTIGQYIGLKDKNGTKIFEGDILRISIKDSDDKIEYKFGAVEFSDKTLGYIIRSKGGLMCSFNTILNSAGFYEFELEVIGNIYDNKDLLK